MEGHYGPIALCLGRLGTTMGTSIIAAGQGPSSSFPDACPSICYGIAILAHASHPDLFTV